MASLFVAVVLVFFCMFFVVLKSSCWSESQLSFFSSICRRSSRILPSFKSEASSHPRSWQRWWRAAVSRSGISICDSSIMSSPSSTRRLSFALAQSNNMQLLFFGVFFITSSFPRGIFFLFLMLACRLHSEVFPQQPWLTYTCRSFLCHGAQ